MSACTACGTELPAGAKFCFSWRHRPGRRLRGVRGRAARRGALLPGVRDCAGRCFGAHVRSPARRGPSGDERALRRPGRLHHAVGGARPGGGPRAAVARTSRTAAPIVEPLRRHRREVHRRRGDGGLGRADRARGRRRARRARRPRAGRRASRRSASDLGRARPGRCGSASSPARSRSPSGATQPGHGRRRRGQHRGARPVRGRARQVWVDETTRLLTSVARSTYVDVGIHAMKGKAEPVPLWSVRAVVAGVGGAQRADGLEAPLVGRDRELRLVKEFFHACRGDAAGRGLLVVDGEAGVGKSRLGWEFEKYVDGFEATRALAPRPVPVLRRGRRLTTRWPRRSAAGSRRWPRRDAATPDDDAALLAARPGGLRRRTRRSATGSSPRLPRCSASARRRLPARGPVLGVDGVLRDGSAAERRSRRAGGRRRAVRRRGLLAFLEHLLAAADFPVFVLALARPGCSPSTLPDRQPPGHRGPPGAAVRRRHDPAARRAGRGVPDACATVWLVARTGCHGFSEGARKCASTESRFGELKIDASLPYQSSTTVQGLPDLH